MKRILLVISLFQGLAAIAQDLQFSQFYAAPLYLNPAFTGNSVCGRVSSNYRNQWPQIGKGYVSYAFSADHYLPTIKSGIGLLVTNDKAGTGDLRTLTINGLYAYELTLTKKWSARAGFEAGIGSRSVDISKLTFADQISRGGASATVETRNYETATYFDISSGFLLYSLKHWIGFAAHHLNTPNTSLLFGENQLPLKYSVHAGTKIPINQTSDNEKAVEFISPAINYKGQAKFDQVDVGCYYTKNPIVFGVWYRGIPLFKSYQPGYANNDGIIVTFGINADKLRIGYSYDFTISKLVGSTKGAHEVSFAYQLCTLKPKKRKKPPFLVPCPKF
jgi:type IX secretion system PorP/SprF family membrane protein